MRWPLAVSVLSTACAGAAAEIPTVELPAARPPPAEAPIADGQMVRVPGGRFRVGAGDAAALPDDGPVHEVTLPAFEIDLSEVTVAAYQRCVDARRCTPAGSLIEGPDVSAEERELYSQFCIGNRGDRPDHPVNCVDHAQAQAYCGFAGKRLPTEEEWEAAARGPLGRAHPWGGDPPDPELCNVCDLQCARGFGARGAELRPMLGGSDGFETTAPVRSFPEGRSPFGVFDMAGNVVEWTASPGCRYDRPDCGAASRVLRGGGWLDGDARRVRATARAFADPATRSVSVGFRCAR